MPFSAFAQDLRYAFRAMTQSPLFTTIAMVSLAIGIGANTAIFTLLDQLLLRPLPIRDPHSLVQLDLPGPRSGNNWANRSFSYPMYLSLRDGNKVFDGLAAQFIIRGAFATGEQSENVTVHLVSGNWFETLGVPMQLGRAIGPADDVTVGGHPVVVLSDGFWRRRFAGDKSIVNQTVLLNGQRMTVLGVAAGPFRGTDVTEPADVMVPVVMQRIFMPSASYPVQSPRLTFLNLFGRVKPGVRLDEVRTDLNRVLAPVLIDELKALNFNSANISKRFLAKQIVLYPAASGTFGDRDRVEQAMWLLTALVGGVLLIACANVANLLLARATVRRREVAVRLALGASRWQLIRLVLAESLLLAIAGGALGLLAAAWAGDALVAFVSASGNGPLPINSTPDARILLFTLALSLFTALLFGLGPAWAASKSDMAPALKDEAGNLSGGAASNWARKGLIVFQVALSLMLLAAAALFLRTLDNLRKVNPGFNTEHLVSFAVDPSMNGYDVNRQSTFYSRLTEEISALPGVSAVTLAAEPLMADSNSQSTVRVEGYQAGEDEDMNPFVNQVGPGFFRNLTIPLLQGRDFNEADVAGAPAVAIVSETFAKMYFKDRDPIGRKIGFARHRRPPDITIVGVAKEPKQLNLRDSETPRQVYTPSAQAERVGGRVFYVRTNAPLEAIAPGLRAAVRALDPALAVDHVRTMEQQIEVSLVMERVISTLCAAFGFIATLMAAVGLYGVMAFHVSRRTREIGIRMALGAQRSDVLGMVFREAGGLALLGVAIGVPAAIGLGQFAKALLFNVEPNDALVYTGAAVMLLATAVLASILPARRASRVEPIRALRYE
ncbi:MAG: ABC transporter permease [Acidobacteria bacterium]|nr:ABC transporter permease [Acidobacteriota bacterium]